MTSQDKLFKITVNLVMSTYFASPIVKLFILRNNICAPPYLGSILLAQCTRGETSSILGTWFKFLIYFIEWFIPVQSLWSSMFYFVQVYYGGLTYLLDYLDVLDEKWYVGQFLYLFKKYLFRDFFSL